MYAWEDEYMDWPNDDREKGELSEWACTDCQELAVCATQDTLPDVKNTQENKNGQ
jgi:hypothetical protein